MTLTRRMALASGAALPLATLPAFAQAPAQSAKPPARPEVQPMTDPRAHRIAFGSMTVTVLLAGRQQGANPHETFGLNASAEDFAALSQANFIPDDRMLSNYCPVVVRSGDEVVLFDTGLAPEGIRGPLADAGLAPADITTVVLTHMHGDHIGGFSDGTTLTFPEAKFVAGRVEMEHWLGAGNETFDTKVRPFADRFTLIEGGTDVIPGITAREAFGHTPGHMAFLLTNDANDRMLIAADTANHYVWSLARPDWEVRFDMDKASASTTRREILSMLAEERIPFIGYHMPFPAVGYVAETEGGFRFMPATYQFAFEEA